MVKLILATDGESCSATAFLGQMHLQFSVGRIPMKGGAFQSPFFTRLADFFQLSLCMIFVSADGIEF